MNKKLAGAISMVSILFSPLLGGIIGRLIANLNILDMSTIHSDDGLCYVGAIAWIVASIMFYMSFKKEDN